MIAPAKGDVYPGRLPNWAQDLRGFVSLDLLMKTHPELPFIDTRPELREAGQVNATYSPLNSHWTYYGGYVAWQTVTSCLRASDTAFASLSVPPISGVTARADFNEFASFEVVPSVQPTWTVPVYSEPLPATTAVSLVSGDPVQLDGDNVVDMTQLPVETTSENAQSDLTLLALRDSTGSALSPLWSTSFAHTVQFQHGVGGTGEVLNVGSLVSKYKPNVTLFVMTERYLDYGPPIQ